MIKVQQQHGERYQPWLKRSLDEEDPSPVFEDTSSLDRYLTVYRSTAAPKAVGSRVIDCTTDIGKNIVYCSV
jgi:hypothetical protein